jgi:predicted O-methyltransferase YrrM
MRLAEFYRNTVDANDKETAGWSIFYYGVFSKVINDNNYKRVAEIGVAYGTHAKQILSSTNLDQLYLIDSMVEHEGGFHNDIMSKEPIIPGNNFNELYELVQNELATWKSKFTFLRQPSLSVTEEQIPDGSLDCIFIDADHSYKAVLADLTFWWKKLRVGGQMMGDDFWIDGVQKAVNEFASTNGLTYDFLYRPNTQYKIFRFIKS